MKIETEISQSKLSPQVDGNSSQEPSQIENCKTIEELFQCIQEIAGNETTDESLVDHVDGETYHEAMWTNFGQPDFRATQTSGSPTSTSQEDMFVA